MKTIIEHRNEIKKLLEEVKYFDIPDFALKEHLRLIDKYIKQLTCNHVVTEINKGEYTKIVCLKCDKIIEIYTNPKNK